ncbi:MAG: hypothetical protein G8237_00805 [Magnetococcales bacterium]|nr:hypothetical protein [Magnetococcales bacterium]NGZ04877.1 hypothetical protein [Magnetococcales bacterium]
MRDCKRNAFSNGLLARGFVNAPEQQTNPNPSAWRGWSFGFGRGISGVGHRTGWARLESPVAGGEA